MPLWPCSGSPVELVSQRLQLALRAEADELPPFQRGNAGGVVAAVFEALERVDEVGRDRFAPENSDDPAHGGWDAPF